MRNAAQYLRMSTDQQRYSLANQTELIRTYAERHGFTVVKSYEDAGRSGVTTARRDGLKRLLHDVVAGSQPYATILVVDVSRWGRYQNPDEGAHYEFLCREAGVSVLYCAEAFDNDNSPTSAIVKSLKRVMAADYSRQLSDRCQAGVRRQTLAGFAQGGAAPFGAVRRSFSPDGTPGVVLREGERCARADRAFQGPGRRSDVPGSCQGRIPNPGGSRNAAFPKARFLAEPTHLAAALGVLGQPRPILGADIGVQIIRVEVPHLAKLGPLDDLNTSAC